MLKTECWAPPLEFVDLGRIYLVEYFMSDLKDIGQILRNKAVIFFFLSNFNVHANQLRILLKGRLIQ